MYYELINQKTFYRNTNSSNKTSTNCAYRCLWSYITLSPHTWDGNKYFVNFLDDYSDYTHFFVVFLISSKNKVHECFKVYEAMTTTRFNNIIVCLRCDNGGEYVSQNQQIFCQEKGIQLEFTVPYTPEQNEHAKPT
uniref:Copia protein n=1 Tax=Schizaphis graminum TaxID=13262 RepID=A0A2S2P5G9_SCHGA